VIPERTCARAIALTIALAACSKTDPSSAPAATGTAPTLASASAAATDKHAGPTVAGFDEAVLRKVPPRSAGGQVLGPDGRALKDALVSVKTGPVGAQKPVPGAKVIVDQLDKAFVPRVVPVVVGTTVEFKNSDAVLHNVYSRSGVKTFDLGAYSGKDAKSAVFDKPGRIDVFCAIHTNMHAIVHVLETPHFATTDAQGAFTIRDLPPGHYVLSIWDETSGHVDEEVDVAADKPAVLRVKLSGEKPR
jgi:plastocyanin